MLGNSYTNQPKTVQGHYVEENPANPTQQPNEPIKVETVPHVTRVSTKQINIGSRSIDRNLCACLSILCCCCCCCLILIIILVAIFWEDCDTVNLKETIRVSQGDYISLVFLSCPSNSSLRAFELAASRLSAVLLNQESTLLSPGGSLSVQYYCQSENEYIYEANDYIEPLTIFVEPISIDGSGGVLARAGPCAINPVNDLSAFGLMQFDSDDLEVLDSQGALDDVILHEMLHVVGFGSLWDYKGDLLVDPVWTYYDNGGKYYNSAARPRFIGQSAISEFEALGEDGSNGVPIEDGIVDGVRVLGRSNSEGSVDSHLDLDMFSSALMTYSIDYREDSHPLTRVTLGSLADLGYTVNMDEADEYSLSKGKAKVQAQKSGRRIEFGDDILKVKPKRLSLV
eukprot:maker-scaffold_35-snap-gene-1.53-mRNA-1 protein AED:0.01 eAED:0.01 QI:105/1/1/1/1/1/3/211/397